MAVVYFKPPNTLNYGAVSVVGNMDVAHFKAALRNCDKLKNEDAFDLSVKDSVTKAVLEEEDAIPEHRHLIILRIPKMDYVRRGPKKSKDFDDQAPTKMAPAPMPTQAELKGLFNPETTEAEAEADELVNIRSVRH